MKENLLVTLADENYLDQAKQLFSSAYWNGGWKGDYMLLAYAIPEGELAWFREKGILVRSIPPAPVDAQDEKWVLNYPHSIFGKFYVFTPEFKKWKHVVFLDGDIIVKADINALAAVQGFNAVPDMLQFIENQVDDYAQATMQPDLTSAKAFNSGVFCFSTDIIEDDMFQKICAVAGEYAGRTIYFPDQAVLNIFFYGKWKELPLFFNLYYLTLPRSYWANPSKIQCAILHFAGDYKPWDVDSLCRPEWEENLRRAETTNFRNPSQSAPQSFNRVNVLYIRYLCKIKFVSFYRKFIRKTLKRLGVTVGYFERGIVLGHGWYVPEYDDKEKRFFIWNTRHSELFIEPRKINGVELDIMRSPLNKTAFTVEGYHGDSLVAKHEYPPETGIVRISVDAGVTKVKFSNAIFIPAYDEEGSRDIRRLGIALLSPLFIRKKSKTVAVPLQRVASHKHAKVKK